MNQDTQVLVVHSDLTTSRARGICTRREVVFLLFLSLANEQVEWPSYPRAAELQGSLLEQPGGPGLVLPKSLTT